MAPSARSIVVESHLFEKLKQIKKGAGVLYGFVNEDLFEVLGISLCDTATLEAKVGADGYSDVTIESDLMDCLSYTQDSLPGGVEIIGLGLIEASDFQIRDTLENACSAMMAKGVFNTDTPVLLLCDPSTGTVTASTMNESYEMSTVAHKVTPLASLLKSYLVLRVRGQLVLNMENSEEGIKEELDAQIKRAASGVFTFVVRHAAVFLRGSEEDGVSGINYDKPAKLLASKPQDEGKKKKKAVSDTMDIVDVDLLEKAAKFIAPDEEDPITLCAPVIQLRKKDHENARVPLQLDCLAVVGGAAHVHTLYAVLVDSLRRQLVAVRACLLRELASTKRISLPRPHHFHSELWGGFLTLVYPKNVPDASLESVREKRHAALALPTDRPFFRRGCSHIFPSDVSPTAPLLNPHEGLVLADMAGAEVGVVSGRYSYHHYLQDGKDDNGWGCAYRSLQTIVSWFRLQGYTETPVPTHLDIQKCLVNIGDKPPSFQGSKQWIGSTEVGFCLETLLGVTSRVLSVSSGEELSGRGDELLRHFSTQGTPIMIGGGVLAHTILGVAVDREAEQIRFLILDPHYTAGEDLAVVQGKGWCGWKGPDFWSKAAFYNLCMPQRPKCL